MKYFVISDIHSHYDAMTQSLQKAGFNSDNHEHNLIVLGDLFDRGENAVKVYHYLSNLTKKSKATIIVGNHDLFLLDFLDKKYDKVRFNMAHNGFDKTLSEFSGLDANNSDLDEIHENIINKFPKLHDWLNHLLPYHEIGKYIFVHGGIDGTKEDWKKTKLYELVWNREINLEPVRDKIVVAGHHRTATIRSNRKNYVKLFKNHPEQFDIINEKGKILIDRFVEITNSLNVLILEEKDML